MMKYRIIAIFVLLFIHFYTFGESFYGKRISIENGLSQASATCVIYDDDGALWIGTRFGLNQYSNGKLRSFLDSSLYGLSGCRINGLFVDSAGTLWVASEKGVCTYDRYSDSFIAITQKAANCVYEYDGIIYIGGHDGTRAYSKEDSCLESYMSEVWTDVLSLYSYDGKLLSIDRRNGIRLGTGNDVSLLDIPEIENRTIMASSMLDDRLYLSILGEGVLVYNLKERRTEEFIRQGESGLSRELILSSCAIDGDIWLGTDGNGVLILDTATNTVTYFNQNHTLNPGTEVPTSVTCLYQDPLGNIWEGGVLFGVTGLKSTAIRTFIQKSIISTLSISSDGILYVGTEGDGIFRYSKEESELYPIESTDGMKITCVTDYDDRRILFCAYNMGFFLLDRKTGTIQPFVIIDRKTNNAECFYGNSPEASCLPDGRILIYALNTYLHNPIDGSFRLIKDNSVESITDLHYAMNDGDIVYSYNETGLYYTDTKSFTTDIELSVTSEDGAIRAVAFNDSSVVIGTDYGIFNFSRKDKTKTKLNTNFFTRVTAIQYDKEGKLWIGADNSVFVYENGMFELIGENYGVPANEISVSICRDDGTIFLGGSSGLFEIRHDVMLSSTSTPKTIKLHDITLSGKKLSGRNGKIRIPWNYEGLMLSFGMSGLDPFEKVVYRYMVEGSKNFAIESFDEKIELPGLSPGIYSIKVSHNMKEGQWSDPESILTVQVMRPWYSSILAMIIYFIILVTGVVIAALAFRKRVKDKLEAEMRAKDAGFIAKFEQYVEQHLPENELNVDRIAAELAMSRATLYTKVRNSFKIGVGEYIESKRMEKAKELLSNTSLSVAEIAEKTGYSTPRYFSMRFKVKTGVSPLNYRHAGK